MGGTWRNLPKTSEQVEKAAEKAAEDELVLRRQCLEWAFQTRDFTDVPHMDVLNVAQSYYDFIKGARVNPLGYLSTK